MNTASPSPPLVLLASPRIRDFGAAEVRESGVSMMDGNASRFGFPIRFVLSLVFGAARYRPRVSAPCSSALLRNRPTRINTRPSRPFSFRETVLLFEKLISRRRYRALASPIKDLLHPPSPYRAFVLLYALPNASSPSRDEPLKDVSSASSVATEPTREWHSRSLAIGDWRHERMTRIPVLLPDYISRACSRSLIALHRSASSGKEAPIYGGFIVSTPRNCDIVGSEHNRAGNGRVLEHRGKFIS